MGLFGKKKKENLIEDFENFNMQSFNDDKKSRKETREEIKDTNIGNGRKNAILNKLNELRRKMYNIDGFEDFADSCERIMSKLKQMDDNSNRAAMEVIDNFIINSLKECEHYCFSNNYVGANSCMFVIENFVNDRHICGPYYTNKNYIKMKLIHNKYYIELQNQQSKYDDLHATTSNLMEQYNNPNSKVNKSAIEREFNRNKEKLKGIKTLIGKLDKTLSLLDKSLLTYEQNSINHEFDSEFDIITEMEDVLEIGNNNDYATIDKLANKLEQINNKVIASDVNVDTGILHSNNDVNAAPKKLSMDDLD